MEIIAELPNKGFSSEFTRADKPAPPDGAFTEKPENAPNSRETTLNSPQTNQKNADPLATTREHIRAPELHRNSVKILMALAAVSGAVAGIWLAFGGGSELSAEALDGLSRLGGFGATFWRQVGLGAAFMAVECVLGFFAFGDLLVWAVPFFCAMGAVLQASAGSPLVIAAVVVRTIAITAGAVYSADMSVMLLRLSRGGTVHLGTRPRRTFALGLLGGLAGVVFSAILAGVGS